MRNRSCSTTLVGRQQGPNLSTILIGFGGIAMIAIIAAMYNKATGTPTKACFGPGDRGCVYFD